jgi:hypothetical protein
MNQATLDCPFSETRNRLTVAFRIILVIPHLIVLVLWGLAVFFAVVGQWFVCVFTGKRNRGIWDFVNGYLGYSARVTTYFGLLHDVFPPFGTSQGAVPAVYGHSFDEPVNRLTAGLRIFWAIPAIVIEYFLRVANQALAFLSWLFIIFTGKQPRGLFDFMIKAQRYSMQSMTYLALQTDKYPAFE